MAQEPASAITEPGATPAPPAPESPAAGTVPDKHAFGVLANYRTAEETGPYTPITVRQKFTIARKDTLDGPSYVLAAFFSGISQLNDTNPSFGQGLKGYGRRYISSIADQGIGNYLTEAILPSALHQDPRYFRRGHGSVIGRIFYAASRSAVAKNDSGKWTFNTAEFLGNGMVASLGNAYYPDEIGFKPTMQRMFTQIGTDSVSQVLKEFWPDVKRKFFQKHAAS
ncbi:MAG: hypothetical protein ABUS49_07260 [Acidobacteriota bacterium]